MCCCTTTFHTNAQSQRKGLRVRVKKCNLTQKKTETQISLKEDRKERQIENMGGIMEDMQKKQICARLHTDFCASQ